MPNLPTLFHRVHIRRATKGTVDIVQIYHDTYDIVKRWTWRSKGVKRGERTYHLAMFLGNHGALLRFFSHTDLDQPGPVKAYGCQT